MTRHARSAPPLAHLLDRAGHALGRHPLALLDVHRPAGAPAATSRSVCRHRKAGIWSTSATCGGGRHLRRLVHVGQDRQARWPRAPAPAPRGPPSRPGPRAAASRERFALSKRRLVDDGQPEPRRPSARQVLADARGSGASSSTTQGPAIRNGRRTERRGAPPSSSAATASVARRRPALRCGGWRTSYAAAMKLANSGCGRVGRDFSSGWNWQPTNHGCSGSSIISTSEPSGERPRQAHARARRTGRGSRSTPRSGGGAARSISGDAVDLGATASRGRRRTGRRPAASCRPCPSRCCCTGISDDHRVAALGLELARVGVGDAGRRCARTR